MSSPAASSRRTEKPQTAFVALQNPLLSLREFARISQEAFAAVVEVDVQFIYRVENGLVNSVPDRIFEEMFYYVPYQEMTALMMNQFIGAKRPQREILEISSIGLSGHKPATPSDTRPSESAKLETYVSLCQYWFSIWVLSRRERIRLQLNSLDFALPERHGAPKEISPMQFREWVMSYFPSEDRSQHSFCRKFLIHPSTVQRWEKQKKSVAPPTIVKAMSESGINIAGRVFK